jgi:pimeloyl-ACP methyl ester carboxylesterase
MIIVAGGIQIRHLVYRLTYNGDVVAFKMGRRQGAAVPISEKLSEMIIEDTLRGAPQAKRAWPEAGMIEDISSAVPDINVPTLVLAGENDQVERVATLERELIPRIPDAQMKVIPRSGHLSLLEVPDEIAAGIRNFLASLKV